MLFRRGVKSYISKAALALQEGVLKCEKFVLCKQLAPWSWSLSRASVAVVAVVVVIDVS